MRQITICKKCKHYWESSNSIPKSYACECVEFGMPIYPYSYMSFIQHEIPKECPYKLEQELCEWNKD